MHLWVSALSCASQTDTTLSISLSQRYNKLARTYQKNKPQIVSEIWWWQYKGKTFSSMALFETRYKGTGFPKNSLHNIPEAVYLSAVKVNPVLNKANTERATSLVNSFCSNVAKQVARFLLPVYCSFSPIPSKKASSRVTLEHEWVVVWFWVSFKNKLRLFSLTLFMKMLLVWIVLSK